MELDIQHSRSEMQNTWKRAESNDNVIISLFYQKIIKKLKTYALPQRELFLLRYFIMHAARVDTAMECKLITSTSFFRVIKVSIVLLFL